MQAGVFQSTINIAQKPWHLVSFGIFFAQLYKYQTTNPSKKYKILGNSCKELTKINDAMWTVRICLKNDLHSWRRCIFALTVQLWRGTCSRCVLLHWTQNMKPGLILWPFTSLDATLTLVLIHACCNFILLDPVPVPWDSRTLLWFGRGTFWVLLQNWDIITHGHPFRLWCKTGILPRVPHSGF